jgi:large subunit ribosomal protein L29
MKAEELQQKEDSELRELEGQLNEEMFRLKIKHYTGQLQETHLLKVTRRNIARIKTILKARRA